ncbi:hypothetical protein J3F83DRAFT_714218 [Trichoderma novae-zelandiae]
MSVPTSSFIAVVLFLVTAWATAFFIIMVVIVFAAIVFAAIVFAAIVFAAIVFVTIDLVDDFFVGILVVHILLVATVCAGQQPRIRFNDVTDAPPRPRRLVYMSGFLFLESSHKLLLGRRKSHTVFDFPVEVFVTLYRQRVAVEAIM